MFARVFLALALVLGAPALGQAETALSAAAAGAAPASAIPTEMPTVVELFTSQGCDSCPPADAFLTELARRHDIIALTYDVDYWNYLGWRDTFATPQTTGRQKAYAERLSNGELYTPEMVIGGAVGVAGSDRAAVESAIARVARSQKSAEIIIKATRDPSGQVRIVLPAGTTSKPAVVWLIGYDKTRVVKIMRGENRGHSLAYTNVVRTIRAVGQWSGKADAIRLDPALLHAADHALVLVQVAGAGPIIGCVKLPVGKGT